MVSNVVPITSRPRSQLSRDARDLVRVLRHAHAWMDARPTQYPTAKAARGTDVLTWEAYCQQPARTSIFGWPL